ncbi:MULTISPECIES: non-hydrolyzing UDP-N-acetylglucosamine 2-epimerase [unclassified Spirosoma]|uniref:non-hydrolyzing UDP-N-acetylglucosamine 2-epimerase n=1 Tax=unclassified Spirosoma TaxID=2621999 RepID=UPI00095EA375|nr:MULTISPECIES: UDP-N-acetylglucosamine 2-epimerase (non-hydrolyzing) [unclassified Spirosoma]MBN8826812.1 UDP-N-acetylglucosamine 2-epimerase (non-hydrolyzing) [Spirosoma sp.]OJW73616.1 MAG: UDP-N-acetylglucosamine 2-epimerase [Spirosoma sp. 48-14]
MKIINVVGARPNFIKLAPLHRAFSSEAGVCSKIVHTGQHTGLSMSDVFFRQLALPEPDYHLHINTESPTRQLADILVRFEQVLTEEQPDWVLVIGDVTSTLACALAAAQQGIRIAHVEAGLRSGDRQMPEERNRILTDALSERLFVTEQAGVQNLQREGISAHKVHLVGNVLIDALVQYRSQATELNMIGRLGLSAQSYVLVTIHRPFNVDTETSLRKVLELIETVALQKTVIFPVHPRTQANLLAFGLEGQLMDIPNVRVLEPLSYLEFLNLMENAAAVITDSGGVQEETTYLQVPCLTVRPSTERPVTLTLGTNQLISELSKDSIRQYMDALPGQMRPQMTLPGLWDGRSANRIVNILLAAHYE